MPATKLYKFVDDPEIASAPVSVHSKIRAKKAKKDFWESLVRVPGSQFMVDLETGQLYINPTQLETLRSNH